MKKIYKSLVLMTAIISMATVVTSCAKEEIPLYSGEDAIFFDQLYKGAANEGWLQEKRLAHQNYTMVNFNTIAENDSTLSIKIQTAGYTRDYERPFGIEIVADSTTAVAGEEFELLNPSISILPGEDHTYAKVKLLKSERMFSELLQIQLKLIPGEYFTFPFGKEGIGTMPLRYGDSEVATEYGMNTDPSYHNVFVTAQLTQPAFWVNMLPGNVYYIGKYSNKKYELIIKLCEEKFGWTVLDFAGTVVQEKIGMINRTLRSYLTAEFKKGKDHYVLEEDGTLMWVKGCAWPEGSRPEDMVE